MKEYATILWKSLNLNLVHPKKSRKRVETFHSHPQNTVGKEKIVFGMIDWLNANLHPLMQIGFFNQLFSP